MLTGISYSLSLKECAGLCLLSQSHEPLMENQLLEQSIVLEWAEKAGQPPKNHQGNWLRVQIPGLWPRSPWSSGAEASGNRNVPKASEETVVSRN